MQWGIIVSRLRRLMPVERFNRLCRGAALLWLLVTIPVGMVLRPTWFDFTQFYTGGLVARLGGWNALYPIPRPGSLDNPGMVQNSAPKEFWSEVQAAQHVHDTTHFMLPPPSVLLFVPLSFFSYQVAFGIWVAILIGCTWGVARMAGWLYRSHVGYESRWEGLLALAVVLSPMVARAIRIMNVTPVLSLCIGMALLGLLRHERPARQAVAIVLGMLLKYATLILLPLYVAARRWRTLAWVAGLSVAVLAVSFALMGKGPFVEFADKIVPTLSRPSIARGNQSMTGYLVRVCYRPLPMSVAIPLGVARISLLLAALGLIFRRRPEAWQNPVCVSAAGAMLLSWLIAFSPISWEHYPIFLCPLWGWMLWEARQDGWQRFGFIAAWVLMNLPISIIGVKGFMTHRITLPEPLNSIQLWGVLLTMFLAMWRLSGSWQAARRLLRPAELPARVGNASAR
ncbi:MAG: glycosyltransferase family 87 protein [Bacillota bacterium]